MRLLRPSLSRSIAVALAACLAALPELHAQRRILVNTHPSSLNVYGGLHHGGGAWSEMTALIDGTFGNAVTKAERLTNLHQMLQHDVLWIDQRFMDSLTTQERVNLRRFEMTGRRIVLIGENSTWGPWNSDALAVFGARPQSFEVDGSGSCAGGVTPPRVPPVPAHVRPSASQLTRGVSGIDMACAGRVAEGGIPLFEYEVAALIGVRRNVLTILDANVLDTQFQNSWGDFEGNRVFKRNIMSWLARRPVRLTDGYEHPWPGLYPTEASVPDAAAFAETVRVLDELEDPAILPPSPHDAIGSDDLRAVTDEHQDPQLASLRRIDDSPPSDAAVSYFEPGGFAASATTTPEPATMALLGGGLAALGALRRRRRSRD